PREAKVDGGVGAEAAALLRRDRQVGGEQRIRRHLGQEPVEIDGAVAAHSKVIGKRQREEVGPGLELPQRRHRRAARRPAGHQHDGEEPAHQSLARRTTSPVMARVAPTPTAAQPTSVALFVATRAAPPPPSAAPEANKTSGRTRESPSASCLMMRPVASSAGTGPLSSAMGEARSLASAPAAGHTPHVATSWATLLPLLGSTIDTMYMKLCPSTLMRTSSRRSARTARAMGATHGPKLQPSASSSWRRTVAST